MGIPSPAPCAKASSHSLASRLGFARLDRINHPDLQLFQGLII